jgi:hypothetical protein
MQYEQPQQKAGKTGKAIERNYILLAYNLPYREAKAIPNAGEENSETDPYTQIFVSQTKRVAVYSYGLIEYVVKPRREIR